MIRVMTYNLKVDHLLTWTNRWNKRSTGIFKLIDSLNIDIIGLQEINKKMYGDISKKLSNYYIVGRKRKHGLFAESNNILVNKKYSIIKEDTFWLSKTPWIKGSSHWHSSFPRICTTALIDLGCGKVIRVYNTHLDSVSARAREFGLKVIGKSIELSKVEENVPIILMGDFNTTPNNELIYKMKHNIFCSKRLKSLGEYKKELYDQYTYKGGFRGKDCRCLDYIFISDEIKFNNGYIISNANEKNILSDHYPLVGEFDIDI